MTGLFCEMGVYHSKLNHKVRRVAPLENKDVYVSPTTTTSGVKRLNTSSFGILGLKAPTSDHQLPPLRESLYGRGSVVPRPLCSDVSLDNGDTSSIIKRHPPRRLQELEKKVVAAQNSRARRQYIHKMQIQEINSKREQMNHLQSQAEMKRNIHRETKINKHKMKEIKAKKVRENAMKCREDEDFLPVEHDETFNVDHNNTWHWKTQESNSTPDCYRGKGKLEMWFQPHHDGSETNSDSSSTDSQESWLREDSKNQRRPATLFRTRAEKIPTFDEFFDREF